MAIAYSATIGSLSFGSSGVDRGQSRPLLAVDSEVGVGGAGGRCRLHLGDPSWVEVALEDAVHVELDAGDGAQTVFTGSVEQIDRRADALWIAAGDELAKLARAEVEAAYEEVSAGFIIKDLIDQAGAEAGEVEDGPTFPSYVVHRGPRALRHIQRLAELIGAELGSDAEGKVHVRRPQPPASADHRLVWGEDLLCVELQASPATTDSYVVWGEGAAGSSGSDRGHWLPTDLSGVTGDAQIVPGATPGATGSVSPGSGPLARTVIDGAVRSAETASELAQARAQLVALRPVLGQVLCLGRPDIQPGQWIELSGLPSASTPALPLTLRARRVNHQFAAGRGLLTRLEF